MPLGDLRPLVAESKRCKIIQVNHDQIRVQNGPHGFGLAPARTMPEVWAWLVGLGYSVSYTACNKPPKGPRPLGGTTLVDCPKHGRRAHRSWPEAWK